MSWQPASPRDVALAILAARFQNGCKTPPLLSNSLNLAGFQREGVARAWQILQKRGGVLVADSVGLGKTYVGLGLIELALQAGAQVLVTCPASLRRMWRSELRSVDRDSRVSVLSHTQIALGRWDANVVCDFVVVDEAHAFRNPATRRYSVLRELTARSRVVLLTATPINNSVLDLYFQLRLFCSDSAFRDVGIGSLRAAFDEGRDLDRVLRSVVVRRTRTEVRLTESGLRFPGLVHVVPVGYCLPTPPTRLAEHLRRLSFPGLRASGNSGLEVVRFSLLKRLESSVAAIQMSLDRRIRFYCALERALDAGRTLSPATWRSFQQSDGSAEQLLIDELLCEPAPGRGPNVQAAVREELETLRSWRNELRATHDDKLEKLVALLRERRPARTIVFSEFRDTARYLWRQLRRRFTVGRIDGAGAWIGESPSSRRLVVERFAPCANQAPVSHAREAIEVLVATDVLAEGLNLQDADAVISYDLPWNPVRLIQRSGRIDRIGSPHAQVSVYNFIPDREFDAFIGLARTIRTKLEAVRSTIGLERAVLEPEDLIARLRTESYDILTELEQRVPALLRRAFVEAGPVRGIEPLVGRMADATGQRALVCFERGGDWQVVWADVRAGPTVTSNDPDGMLLAALSDRVGRPIDSVPIEQLVVSARRGMSNPPLKSRSEEARLAWRIRALIPRDADPEVYRRADRALQTLNGVFSQREERTISRLVDDAALSLMELLDACEKLKNCEENEASWRLVGVLVAD